MRLQIEIDCDRDAVITSAYGSNYYTDRPLTELAKVFDKISEMAGKGHIREQIDMVFPDSARSSREDFGILGHVRILWE